MKTLLFAYDFPHKKSVDFLLRMCMGGHPPALVVGAPWRKINVRSSRVRTGHATIDAQHPADVARFLNIPYTATDHDAPELAERIRSEGFELGVIGGARILRDPIIDAFRVGVLNLHPGLIPENRGLDNIQYAVHGDMPMAVTAHLIDRRVDAGRVLERYLVPTYAQDSLIDVGQRNLEAQNLILTRVLHLLAGGDYGERVVPASTTVKNTPGNPAVDAHVEAGWTKYVEAWAVDLVGWRCTCGGRILSDVCNACERSYEVFGKLLRERNE